VSEVKSETIDISIRVFIQKEDKTMKKIGCIFFTLLLLMSTPVFAAEKNINAKGLYIAGASESLNDAKQNALEDAMRQAAEQAGVLVSSFSKTHNMQLTDDEVTVLATKIIQIKDKKFEVELLSDSEIKVIAYIDAVVNTDSINEDVIGLKNKNKELEWQKNQSQEKQRVLHEIDDLNAHIVEEYGKRYHELSSYTRMKELNVNMPWREAVNKFDSDMSTQNYYSAGGSIWVAIIGYKNSKSKSYNADYFDDVVFDLEMKNIEYNIVKHDYVKAFHYCCYLMFSVDKNNYSKYLSAESKRKLQKYKKILGDYCSTYEPKEYNRIINIKFPD